MKRRHFLGITLAANKDELARRRTIAKLNRDRQGFPWVRVLLAVLVGWLLGWAGAVWWAK